jgi:CheY-like chemotaxis protein
MGFDAIIKSLMEKSFFDIIFIDRNMPGLDGIQCVEKLKKIDSFKKARA